MLTQQKDMCVPTELVPHCPVCGRPMTMNLRCDFTFVEDDGWHAACRRYEDFLSRCRGRRVLFLELGVGANTPGIIKYPFWQMTVQNPNAAYACINQGKHLQMRQLRIALSALTEISRRFCRKCEVTGFLNSCSDADAVR